MSFEGSGSRVTVKLRSVEGWAVKSCVRCGEVAVSHRKPHTL